MPIDLRTACAARYKMDELSETMVVDSQGLTPGFSVNDVTPVAGKVGGALSFNGTSDYISVNNSEDALLFNDDLSRSLWAQIDEGNPANDKDFLGSTETNAIILYYDLNGRLWFYYSVGTSSDGAVISDGQIFSSGVNDWKHIAVTVHKTDATHCLVTLYVNAIPSGSLELNQAMADFTTLDYLYIAQTRYGGVPFTGEYLDGSLDDVIIFNKALSAPEIAFLYGDGAGTEEIYESEPTVTTHSIVKDNWGWNW